MPRQPKPAAQRQNRDRPAIALPSAPVVDPPEPPKGLLPSSVELWRTFWGDPVAHLVRRTDVGRVERWIHLADKLARIEHRLGRQLTVKGSTKQMVVHPLLRQVPSLADQLTKLEDSLGMSELGRRRLNVVLPDEQQPSALARQPQPTDVPDVDPYSTEDDPRLYAIQGGQP